MELRKLEGKLTPEEMAVARQALSFALAHGAQQCRITLSKSLMDLYGTLDGALDKVSHCLDRAMSIALFVDGRYGSFSTNRLDVQALDAFIAKAVATVRMLAEDPHRTLPAPERTCKDSGDGNVLGICDLEGLASLTPERRLQMALDASCIRQCAEGKGWRIVSGEGEYSDSIADIYLIDSNGTECRQTDTSFEYGVEVTLEGGETIAETVTVPKGDPENPLSRGDIVRKLETCAQGLAGKASLDAFLEATDALGGPEQFENPMARL